MEELEIKYRTFKHGLPPQRIKLKIPGWAGESTNHDSGPPQPHHCPPFIDGSIYGLELLFPFDSCKVFNDGGVVKFDGIFPEDCPFEAFAPNHYGYTSCLDIMAPPGYVIRLESHPSFYTDSTWQTPCVVPGHIQTEWWPRIFFIVFKSPPIGQTHIFKKNVPYAQILVLPKKVSYDVHPMDAEEAKERLELDTMIRDKNQDLAEHSWTDDQGNKFNDKYKVMSRLFAQGKSVKEYITQTEAPH